MQCFINKDDRRAGFFVRVFLDVTVQSPRLLYVKPIYKLAAVVIGRSIKQLNDQESKQGDGKMAKYGPVVNNLFENVNNFPIINILNSQMAKPRKILICPL